MTQQSPKLLLDEHIWVGLVPALTQRGFDVAHMVGLGLRGMTDEAALFDGYPNFEQIEWSYVPLSLS